MKATNQINNEEISIDFSCVNCDQMFIVFGKAKLYCSPRCQQDAKLVRYFRACKKDGRIDDPLVREAIRTRFAFAFSEKGYYDEKARKLSNDIRNKIFERENGLCRKCGNAGNEIDHINGDSDDLGNLQLLCRDCHSEKTRANMVAITPEYERYEEIKKREKEFRARIDASTPQRLCDDEKDWNKIIQRQLLTEQRQLLKQIKEDVERITKNQDPLQEELVVQELNELSELRLQLESLELQRQAQIDQILTPEIMAQIEAIETEFSNQKQELNETISVIEGRIKESVQQYGSTIKGGNFQAVFRKGITRWDTKSLDEYSKTHPEVLQFRKEGKGSVAIIKIKKQTE